MSCRVCGSNDITQEVIAAVMALNDAIYDAVG